MDNLVDQSNIAKLRRIEAKGRAAAQADVWEVAAQHYGELFEFSRGWLARNDPNVLWAQTYLTEAWVGLNRLDDAIAAHLELFDLIFPPGADEEREILKYIMQVQGSVANKLIAYKRVKDAVKLLLKAHEKCEVAFGYDAAITSRIRENCNKLLSYREDRSKKKLERYRATLQGQIHLHTNEGSPVVRPPRSLATASTKSPESGDSGGLPSPMRYPSRPASKSSATRPTGLGINLDEPQDNAADFSPIHTGGQQTQEEIPPTDRPRSSSARDSDRLHCFSDTRGRPLYPSNPFSSQDGKSTSSTTRPGWTGPLQSDEIRGSQLSPLLSPASLTQEPERSKSVDLGSQKASSNAGFGGHRDAGERFSDAKLLSDPDESKNIE